MDGRQRHQQNILRTFLRIQPPCRVSLLISALSYRSLGRAQSNRTVINNQGKKKKKKTGVYVIRAFEILLSLLFSARRRRRREFIYFSEFCCRRKKKKKGGKRKSWSRRFFFSSREDSRLALALLTNTNSLLPPLFVCVTFLANLVLVLGWLVPHYTRGGGTDNPRSLEDHFSLDRRSYQPKKSLVRLYFLNLTAR